MTGTADAVRDGRGPGPLWAGVLGPVEARRGGVALPLGSAGRQVVFAILAMGADQVVPRSRLVDGLWERPPASAARVIQTYIGDLRRVLDPDRARWTSGRVLRTTDAGYVLDLPDDGLDLRELDRLRAVEAVRTTDPAAALAAVDAALALWRGEPLSGLTGPFADGQRVRLTELRLTLLERRMRLLVDGGRAVDAAAELAVLTAEHPDRDGLRALQMAALAASGRTAQALAVFHHGGTHRPGRELLELHERILTGNQPEPVDSGFVGRRAEVALLRAVAARPSGLVWVEGPLGSGKSALLRAALPDTEVTWHSVADRATATAPPPSDLVVVDDLHWAADHAFHRFLRWHAQGVVLVVATRPRPNLRALRDRATQVITLGPCADEDIAAIAAAHDPASPVDTLVRESGGNPGFAVAVIEADGDVERVAAARVGQLPATLVEPLRRVALLGDRPTRVEVLAAHPGADWLANAVAAGVLRESGGQVVFAQPSVRRVLLAGLPRAVRVVLHRELAKDLAAAGAPADRVAHHLIDGAAAMGGWAGDWLVGNVDAITPGLAVQVLRLAVGQEELPAATRSGFTATLVRLLLLGEKPAADRQWW
ncbi:BTAD domain-containing putative transcriptional regulator [Actinokineospora inagensis]|uniref:BTAD domain-containing putative transcriptional regulator n=1 Tax=Actinokineospora inagensis TaxID=103730 RepID=UPI00047C43E3|nr:BTAD domain-containing putative transcriptional regulator [Actinokineospora inagensis]